MPKFYSGLQKNHRHHLKLIYKDVRRFPKIFFWTTSLRRLNIFKMLKKNLADFPNKTVFYNFLQFEDSLKFKKNCRRKPREPMVPPNCFPLRSANWDNDVIRGYNVNSSTQPLSRISPKSHITVQIEPQKSYEDKGRFFL